MGGGVGREGRARRVGGRVGEDVSEGGGGGIRRRGAVERKKKNRESEERRKSKKDLYNFLPHQPIVKPS